MTAKVMFSFPEQLVSRMKAVIPRRERSKVLALLLDKEIRTREHNLYLCAKELEENEDLRKDMADLDRVFAQDGLDEL